MQPDGPSAVATQATSTQSELVGSEIDAERHGSSFSARPSPVPVSTKSLQSVDSCVQPAGSASAEACSHEFSAEVGEDVSDHLSAEESAEVESLTSNGLSFGHHLCGAGIDSTASPSDCSSSQQLYEQLLAVDPEMAKRIHPNNKRKILRYHFLGSCSLWCLGGFLSQHVQLFFFTDSDCFFFVFVFVLCYFGCVLLGHPELESTQCRLLVCIGCMLA